MREEKVLFAFLPPQQAEDKVPMLIFLIPEAGWTYMQNGLGHDFDLTNIGLPIKVVIGRTENHATGMEQLRKANGGTLRGIKDVRSADVSFGSKPTQ